ncbi:MAG: alpha/beta hydrolase [Dehalococcoidia bacterium]|nr:alpha/beta hydrolase [Dehalococcoidia bacterium]MDH4299676.1 alpha/beta hydrolase [Dehalococcoidia bacterium]MDH4366516.1 alpha/beta hydrolase [Dehalococcoidia bacterium]
MSIIFVHGSGGCGDIWRYQTDYFPGSHAVDLPGHPDGQILKSVEECVDWLSKYIKERGFEDVVLAGHSLGGAIVMTYALRYPQELKGIIVIGSGARLRVHPEFLAPCEEAIKGDGRKWYKLVEEMYRLTPADYKREIMEKQKAIGPAVMLNDFLCCEKFDVMDRVHEIKLPALIICGESDIMTPVKYANYLGARIANSRVVIVPRAGHFVLAEKPGVVNKAIEDFLREIPS